MVTSGATILIVRLDRVEVAHQRDRRLILNVVSLPPIYFVLVAGHDIIFADSAFKREVSSLA